MKYVFGILVIAYSSQVFSCATESRRHINPDGTQGGLVSLTAKVSNKAFISFDSKVCDHVVVEADSKILNGSQILERAWIRSNVVVSEESTVKGAALLWGQTSRSIVQIKGRSTVEGDVKLSNGTIISESSHIYGSVHLADVIVKSNSEVCGNFIISDLKIDDSYFCDNSTYEFSRSDVSLLNYKEEAFNSRTKNLEFKLSNGNSFDKDNTFVSINDRVLAYPELKIYRNFITLSPEALSEGVNDINILGKDHHNKVLRARSFKVLIGSGTKSFVLQNFDYSEDLNVNAVYIYDEQEYEGKAKIINGDVVLYNLPSNFERLEVVLKGVNAKFLLFERFNIFQAPDSLPLTTLPSHVDNFLNFENDLHGWQISDPAAVILESNVENKTLKIFPQYDRRVEVIKRVKLSSDYVAVQMNSNFGLPIVKRFFSPNYSVDIFIGPVNRNLAPQFVTVNSDNSLDDAIETAAVKTTNDQTEFLIFYRINPLTTNAVFLEDPFQIDGGEIPIRFIDFRPTNLIAKNPPIEGFRITPTNNMENEDFDCNHESFHDPGLKYVKDKSSLNFLSVGLSPLMPSVIENRIFGSIFFHSVKRSDFDDAYSVRLEIRQGDKFIISTLSKCQAQALNNFPKDSMAYSPLVNSIAYPLFNISFSELLAAQFSYDRNVRMQIILNLKNGETLKSPVRSLKLLKAFQKPLSFRYGHSEHYDIEGTSNAELPRMGGDKWIVPAYEVILAEILDIFQGEWKVNDLTKLNGGNYEPHQVHEAGIDADISYEYNFDSFITATQWKNSLDKIEYFLNEILKSGHIGYVRDIYITKFKPVENRFNNRCFGQDFPGDSTRAVDLFTNNGEKSLLLNRKDHKDHLHLRFNHATYSPVSHPYFPESPGDFDLDDLWFELSPELDFWVFIKQEVKDDFLKRKVLWRLQEKNGFEDQTMTVTFGTERWTDITAPQKTKKIERKNIRAAPIFYFYASAVNDENGKCFQREVELDLGDLPYVKDNKNHYRWTYIRNKQGNLQPVPYN